MSFMAMAGLPPQVLSDVTKQALEAKKAPSEIAKNMGAANYYQSEAHYNTFKTSDAFLNHQIAVARAPQEAHNQGMIALEQFKEAVRERDIAKLRGIKAPVLLQKMTGMKDMGDIVQSFGPDSGNILIAAIQSQWHMAGYAAQYGQNELVKKMTLFEKTNADLAKLKETPTAEVWKNADSRQKYAWQTAGITGPRSAATEEAIKRLEFSADQIGLQVYGPAYQALIDARQKANTIVDAKSLPAGTPKTTKGFGSFGQPAQTIYFTPIAGVSDYLGMPGATEYNPGGVKKVVTNPFLMQGGGL